MDGHVGGGERWLQRQQRPLHWPNWIDESGSDEKPIMMMMMTREGGYLGGLVRA